MRRLLRVWLAVTLSLLPLAALAQQVGPNQASFVMGNATGGNQGYGTINATGLFVNGVAVGSGGGCTTNCTISGLTLPTTLSVTGTFNNWSPIFGLTFSPVTVAGGGTGNANNDVLTLNDGCATHGTLVVTSNSGGVVTGALVATPGSCQTAPTGTVSVLSSSGTGTGATFSGLSYGPLVAGIVGPVTAGGNFFLGAAPASGFAGQETILVGNNAGSKLTGSSDFDTITGISAGGGGGSAPFVGISITAYGNDACRDISANSTGVDCFGASALKNQTATISGISVFGEGAALNLNGTASPANLAIFGPAACAGASGSAQFSNATCVGPKLGALLTTANFFTALGGNTATTETNQTDWLVIGTGNSAVDVSASHSINIANIWTVTGINTPSTSASTIAGSLNVIGTLSNNGTPVGSSNTLYAVADSSQVTPVTAGTGYTNGDQLTVVDGCATSTVLTALVTTGAVTGYVITPANRGSCAAVPANPLAVTGGTGTGATFNLSYFALASQIQNAGANGNEGNNFLNGGPGSGYTGLETTLAGNLAGKTLTGASSTNTIYGYQGCGGASGSTLTATSMSCFGATAGKNLAGSTSVGSIDIFGVNSLSAQNQSTRNIAAFGTGSLQNLNTSAAPANDAAFGTSACRGASGATFSSGACFGPNTGTVLSSATDFLLLGPNAGATTYASGSGVILVTSGQAAVDTPLATTGRYINFENIWTVTGTNTPSTSASTIAGSLNVVGTLSQNGTTILQWLAGTTGSIGGGALLAGACTSGTVAVTGSTTAMSVDASPVTYPGDGAYWMGYVSTAGTVTVKVCAAVALTPGASAYNVRVLQ